MVILANIGYAIGAQAPVPPLNKVNKAFMRDFPSLPVQETDDALHSLLSQKQTSANQKADLIQSHAERLIKYNRSQHDYCIDVKKAQGSTTTAFVTVTKSASYYFFTDKQSKASIISRRPIPSCESEKPRIFQRTVVCSGETPMSELFSMDPLPTETLPDLLRFQDERKKTEFLGNATATDAANFLLGKDEVSHYDKEWNFSAPAASEKTQKKIAESEEQALSLASDFTEERKTVEAEIENEIKKLASTTQEIKPEYLSIFKDGTWNWDTPTTQLTVAYLYNQESVTHSCICIEKAPESLSVTSQKYLFKFSAKEVKPFFAYATPRQAAAILLQKNWELFKLRFRIRGFEDASVFF